MHEYGITEEIIKIATRHGKDFRASVIEKEGQGASVADIGLETVVGSNRHVRILKIFLVVGDQSGLVPESIHMYFDIISKGTACEGADLVIDRIHAKLRCSKCSELFERKPYSFECPVCGGQGVPTEIGKEFYIKDVIVEW